MISEQDLMKAKIAYACGEKPISKWRKKDFLLMIKESIGFIPKVLQKIRKCDMYKYLKKTGVYPTGNRCQYRYTEFYKLDLVKIRKLIE